MGRKRGGDGTKRWRGIIRRSGTASSRPGDTILDFFAGSGTFGEAALELGREFILVDSNSEAVEVMRRRFAKKSDVTFETTLAPLSIPTPIRKRQLL